MSADYADYRYCGTEHWDPTFASALEDVIAALSGVDSICELGCGNGALARSLAEKGYRVEGVDASESGIAMARRSPTDAIFHQDLIDRGLGTRLNRTQGFDLVLSSEVIEHLYRPGDLLEAALSVVRPGGWLVLTTPYHGYLKFLALALSGRMERHMDPNWEGGHIKFFSPRTLGALVSRHGYRELSFSYFGRCFALWKSMILVARAPDTGRFVAVRGEDA